MSRFDELENRVEHLEDILGLRGKRNKKSRSYTIIKLFECLCKKYEITEDDIKSSRKLKGLSEKRMFIAKDLEQSGCAISEIAFFMSKDHTSIRYLLKLPVDYFELKPLQP